MTVLHVETSREVDADSWGVALLLGSATAADHWPGLSRLPAVPRGRRSRPRLSGRRREPSGVLVQAVLPAPVTGVPTAAPVPATLLLRARPPQRLGPGTFRLELELRDPAGGAAPVVSGSLLLTPVHAGGPPRTVAALVLDWTVPTDLAADAAGLAPRWRTAADRFLAGLALAAERRATAA